MRVYRRTKGGKPHLNLHRMLAILGCATLPVILNLHYFKRDSYIYRSLQCLRMSGLQKPVCGYPPSLARSQNTGNGIPG